MAGSHLGTASLLTASSSPGLPNKESGCCCARTRTQSRQAGTLLRTRELRCVCGGGGGGGRRARKTSLICRSVKPSRAPGRTSRETAEERERKQLSPLSFFSSSVSFRNRQLELSNSHSNYQKLNWKQSKHLSREERRAFAF